MNILIKKISIISLFHFFIFYSYAQENCSDGIDNDGDGLIDCYDPDCGDSLSCTGFYLSKPTVDTVCKFVLSPNPVFQPVRKWGGTGGFTSYLADIDMDGIPEVISSSGTGINIIDGITGITENSFSTNIGTELYNDNFAIGDIDGDNFGELIASFVYINFGTGGSVNYIVCFEHDGAIKWIDSVKNSSTSLDKYPKLESLLNPINIADFNEDGIAEFYMRGHIFNALDGSMLLAKPNGAYENDTVFAYGTSIAVDILDSSATCPDCNGLEIVAGNKVYSVDITGGNVTPRVIAPSGFLDGYVAVADVNIDGQLDIITNTGAWANGNTIQVYAWDPANESSPGVGTQIGTTINQAGQGVGGRPNVGNYDLDPELEIGVAGKTKYYVYEYNSIGSTITEKWNATIFDQSAYTGSTAFDFDCDGIAEIVYRDEQNLFVYNGSTGAIRFQTPCTSGTGDEFPYVGDVDGDGHADIICGCNNFGSERVTMFSSATNDWAKARSVMNQFNYYNVNINDNLSIPKVQQKHNHPGIPELNSYFNQANQFDENGQRICFTYYPDPELSIDSLINNGCNNRVVLNICNSTALLGEGLKDSTKIIFYSGDPLSGGSILLDTFINGTVPAGTCRSFAYILPAGNYQLYAYINDDGSDPINAPIIQYQECDSMNNWDSVTIVSDSSVSLTGLDSIYCVGDMPSVLVGTPAGGTYSGTGVVGNSFDPTLAGPGGPYTIVYQTGGSCALSASAITRVEPVNPTISNDTTVCRNDTIEIVAGGGNIYSWSPSIGLSCTNCDMPNAYPLNTTIYTAIITDTVSGCSTTENITITVDVPVSIIATSDTSICEGNNITLTVSGGSAYAWSPGSSLDNTNSSSVVASPSTTTIYTVLVDSQSFCADSNIINIMVTVNSNPTIVICCDDTIQPNGNSTIISTSNGSISWSPTIGLNDPNIANPIASPDSNTTYYLTATSMEGCTTTDSVTIYVITDFIVIPNSFTPNNDGLNDEFKIFQSGLKSLSYFKVYNRWGQIVFYSKILEAGWDGTFNGKDQEIGTYQYEFGATKFDGSFIRQQGVITLIR